MCIRTCQNTSDELPTCTYSISCSFTGCGDEDSGVSAWRCATASIVKRILPNRDYPRHITEAPWRRPMWRPPGFPLCKPTY
jgi:hypothetical protein